MERKIPEEKMKQIKEFLNSHSKEYGKTYAQEELYEWEMEEFVPLHEFLLFGLEEAYNNKDIYQSYYNEILSWFDVFERSEDPYAGFVDIIEKKVGSLKGKNILEIGCGPLPALSRIISERMRDENEKIDGTLTAYDPDLVIRDEELPGVTLVRSLFDEKTPLPTDALIVSMTPVVEAAQVICLRVNKEKVAGIIKLGIVEGTEFKAKLDREGGYGLMVSSFEKSNYSGIDEEIISYVGEGKGKSR